jgi:integrase
VKFPRTIKRGSVVVRVYRNPFHGFEVHHYAGGKLKRERAKTKAAAIARAEEIADNLAAGKIVQAEISAADAASFLRAREIIGNRNIELVAAEYMDAVNGLDVPLATVVRLYKQRNPAGDDKSVVDVVEEMLLAKEKEQVSERWLEDLENRLARFSEAFKCPISELSGPDIEDWISGLTRVTRSGVDSGQPVAPRSRKNYRTAVATLVAYAIRRKYLPREFEQEMEDVGFSKAKSAPPEVYTPQEMAALLNATATHKWQSVVNVTPWLAVRAFAGVRHAEAGRIDIKRDIHPVENLIVLGPDVTKTGQSRTVPLCGALLAWLADCDVLGRPQTLCEHAHPDDTVALAHDVAKVPARHNGLRDSYVSYRMAIVGDAGKVAQETGHSPAVLQGKYRTARLPDGRIITKAIAEEYFSIYPPQ